MEETIERNKKEKISKEPCERRKKGEKVEERSVHGSEEVMKKEDGEGKGDGAKKKNEFIWTKSRGTRANPADIPCRVGTGFGRNSTRTSTNFSRHIIPRHSELSPSETRRSEKAERSERFGSAEFPARHSTTLLSQRATAS